MRYPERIHDDFRGTLEWKFTPANGGGRSSYGGAIDIANVGNEQIAILGVRLAEQVRQGHPSTIVDEAVR